MRLWYEDLGFSESPFTVRPTDQLVDGKMTTEIAKELRKRSMVILNGNYGTGKTTVMNNIIKRFSGKRQVIYHNCNEDETAIDFKALRKGAGTFWSRIFGGEDGLVLLLDEAQNLKAVDIGNLIADFERKRFRSVLMVTPKLNLLSKELRGRSKVFKSKALGPEEAFQLIRKRMGKSNMFNKAIIGKILKLNRQPRKFLMNCDDAARNAFARGAKKVSEADIKDLDGNKP